MNVAPSESLPADSELPARTREPDWLLFLRKFLRHGRAIASFVPSSPFLAQAVVQDLDFTQARCIVELGAGTGPITAALLRAASPTCRCLILERDPDFCVRLRQRFPQAEIVEDDAGNLDTILQQRGIAQIDHLLCGLPLPSFPVELRERVLLSVQRHLAPGGSFRQLTHMPWVYYHMYRRYFSTVQFRMVLRNLPPAGFYVCHDWR